jgi:hypothetical protein
MIINFVTFSKFHTPQKSYYALSSFSSTLTLENSKEIKFEKRKRSQTYSNVDYSLSKITYFDFFSVDAFQISKHAKYFAQYLNLETVTPELLLLSCFYCESSLSGFLKDYEYEEFFEKFFFLRNPEDETKIKFSFSKFTLYLDSFKEKVLIPNENIEYSHQINQIFLKAADYAATHFKNPIITSEILFLTLMDENKYSSSKLIKKILRNEVEWYLLRYELIKQLHHQEANIRGEIFKNRQYFGYLLKSELQEFNFEKLLKKQKLEEGVLLFRNLLVLATMKVNAFNLLFKEVKKSIPMTSKRTYSLESEKLKV